jgi:hypothetical protein
MRFTLYLLAGMTATLGAANASAETCHIQSTSAPGTWRFVKVYDVDTGTTVMQRALDGGATREVSVSGQQVRIDFKNAGGKHYKAGPVATCKNGNTVRF